MQNLARRHIVVLLRPLEKEGYLKGHIGRDRVGISFWSAHGDTIRKVDK